MLEPRKVAQEEYQQWEREVIDAFYTSEAIQTQLVPRDGHPSILSKEKVVVVVLEGDGGMPSKVAASDTSGLPEKSFIRLFHIGKSKLDHVGYGVAAAKGQFVHPGIDVGGLTNYRQQVGSEPEFVPGKELRVAPQCDPEAAAKKLFALWATLSRAELPERFVPLFVDVVKSVDAAFCEQGGAVLRFWRPSSEHRVMVTSHDVKQETGRYYERLFGEDAFAVESDGKDLFAGVSEKYITPNMNMRNIEMEYCTY